MMPGGKRNGAGRKSGADWKGAGKGNYVRTDAQRTHAKAVVKRILTSSNDPLTVLTELAGNPDVDVPTRVSAASAAAPFLYPRLSASVVQTVVPGTTHDSAAIVARILGKLERVKPAIEHEAAAEAA